MGGGGIIGGGAIGVAGRGAAALALGQQQQSVAGVHCGVQGALHIPWHGAKGPDAAVLAAVLTGAIVAACVIPVL